MSEPTVPDTRRDRATVAAVLVGVEYNLLTGGLQRRNVRPGEKLGRYTVVDAVEAAAGDVTLTRDALIALEGASPLRRDCACGLIWCQNLGCWLFEDPSLEDVLRAVRAAMARLTLEAVR